MSTRWLVRLGILAVFAVPAAAAAERPLRIAAAGAAVGEWSARVDRLLGSRELVSRLTREDTMLAGRTHERLAQLHRGVPVFGGELARQTDAAGTLSFFGTLYEGIQIAVVPGFGARHAEARWRNAAAGRSGSAAVRSSWCFRSRTATGWPGASAPCSRRTST